MAAKSKKSSAAKRPAAPPAKKAPSAKPDPKALNKEINAILTDEERAGLFIAKHWKKLLAAALIAVVAITGVFAFIRHREAVRKENIANLYKADTIEKLEAELAKAPEVPGVDAARFRLAKLYADKGEFEKARQALQPVVDSSEDAFNRGRAQLSIAYLLELDPAVKKEAAADEFAAIADLADNHVAVRAEAAYAAARLYIDLKQTDKAKEVLDRMLAQLNDHTTHQTGLLWGGRLTELKVSID